MVFMKMTIKYLKKSFFPLVIAAAVPAVLLGLFARPLTPITFLGEYFKSAEGGFFDIFEMLLHKNKLNIIFPYVVIIPAIVLSCSYGLGMIEKDFKTGKLGISNPWRAVNNTMLSILKTIPFLLVFFLIMIFVQCGLVSLIRLIISGSHNFPRIFDGIWTALISIASFMVLVMAAILVAAWCIVMQIYGYSFGDAFVETMHTISKKWFRLVMGLAIPLFVLSVPQLVLNAIPFYSTTLQIVISMFTHLFIFIYFFAYMMVSIYYLNGLERRDNKPYYSV